ncbi:MAG TPA: DUF523 domain-containing protein [bacterium]
MAGDKRVIRVGISSCLLGNPVRYDGGHKLDRVLCDALGRLVRWVPVCPEVECGLPVPRESLHLIGAPASPRLLTVRTGIDHTDRIGAWAARRLEELAEQDLCGFVFKSRSPSCGLRRIAILPPGGSLPQAGAGIFARAVMARFPLLPVEDEMRLAHPRIRDGFVERLLAFQRGRRSRPNAVAGDELLQPPGSSRARRGGRSRSRPRTPS